MHLSVVIPAFNEEKRIGGTLSRLKEYFSQCRYDSEIIVVDDGSADGTAALVKRLFPDVRLLSYIPNRGKGWAVMAGMLSAAGMYRVYYDADGSTPIEEIEKFWPKFEAGADIVIGSRALPDSVVEVHQPRLREVMGCAYNRLLKALALTTFPDTQCGFKGFTARACGIVFPRMTMNRFSFDAELLYIARGKGLRIEQAPVRWIDCSDSRVRLFADSARMLFGTLAIRMNGFMGKYS